MTTITFTTFGLEVTLTPEFSRYSNGRLAIWMRDPATGESYAKVTTNLPEEFLAEDEVFIKDWAENEYLVEALVDAGWIEFTGRKVAVSDWAEAKVAHLAGPLLTAKAESLA